MRPLLLLGILATLSGCSLNYVDTSFQATEKPKHVTEGQGREVADHEGEPVAPVEVVETQDTFPDVPSSHWSYDTSGTIGRTPSVFPDSAPPAGRMPVREDREAKAEGEQRPHAE